MLYFESELREPFLLNALKHHHGFQLEFIKRARVSEYTPDRLRRLLLPVGRLMIDLYYGELTPVAIADEVKKHLISMNHFEEVAYRRFISSAEKKYRTMALSDGSRWTLLIGREEGKYIHIHPSRGSDHSIRVRAIALKTAICLKIFYNDHLKTRNLVELTNEVRANYLDEPPIKNEVYTRGLRRVLELF